MTMRPSSRTAARDALAVVVLGLMGAGIPLWLSAQAGAAGIPSNDDWVYMRGADSLFRTATLTLPGHTAASVGQLVAVQPFLWLSGGNPWAFTAFGLAMTFVGITASYLLARAFLGIGSAVMVGLLVITFPGFERVAASFMTDIPAFALMMVCLLLGSRWVYGGGGWTALVGALVVGLVAVSIREFALAAPAAVLAVGLARTSGRLRARLLLVSLLFALAVAGVLLLAAMVPARGVVAVPGLAGVLLVGPAFATLAAVLLPAVILAIGTRLGSFSVRHLLLAVIVVGLGFVMPFGPLIGHLWMTNGVTGNALLSGTRDPVIGEPAWGLSEQLASTSAVLLAAIGFRWAAHAFTGPASPSSLVTSAIRVARGGNGLLVVFLFGYAAELVAFASVSGIFDRYLFPLVPVAAILLLERTATPARTGRLQAAAHAATGWLAVSALLIAANSLAYDAARFREGEAATAMGYPSGSVDAGYEWVGYHASGPGNAIAADWGLTWYDDALMAARPCAVVSNSPLDVANLTLIREDRSAYRQYLFFGPAQPLYLYGSADTACPPVPAATLAPGARSSGWGAFATAATLPPANDR